MKLGYADPPYLGCCSYYGHTHYGFTHGVGERPFDGGCWDNVETHGALIRHMRAAYPDGWAMSLTAPSLVILSRFVIPHVERIGAWVKPFASFKPGINPGYCWEPVVFSGGRKRGRDEDTVRDFVSANIVLERGIKGAKPAAFCNWILDLLGFQPGDQVDDIFPGSGAFGRVVATRNGVPPEQLTLASGGRL